MNLDEARKTIDQVDKQLLALFEQRMQAVQAVADYKRKNNLPVFDSKREQLVLNKARDAVSPSLENQAVTFVRALMDISKDLERQELSVGRVRDHLLHRLVGQTRTPIPAPRVVVQGIPGAYSHQAAMQMYPDGQITFVKRWIDVFFALRDGLCDYGVLPIENSYAGTVSDVYDLLHEFHAYIVKGYPLDIRHFLLGVRGSNLNQIKKIYTIPIAFNQCRDFFREHHRLELIPTTNTAIAAQMIAKMGDPTCAAVCSQKCASIYGLDVLKEDIQQTDNNCTRFISIASRSELSSNANKISLLFSLPHITGSLKRILSHFSNIGLNLTKIESRPIPDKNFEYIFYLDFTGNLSKPGTVALLNGLKDELGTFQFLGNYFEPKSTE
ncbi:MAG TPA: chorismate mutase [Ruminococcaceae bacterium]|nr:chorismate mutase [Oscillospiraceae bacterium]